MVFGKSFAGALALVALNPIGALAAASAPYCVDGSQVCFSWGVPQAAIQSGAGNIYFQIRAPKTFEWAALGIGSQMNGADIFLMYADGTGNVTLSTRPGLNHIMPVYKARSDVELLAGSGVIDNEMVANVRCGDCTDATLKGPSGWVSAWKVGNPINSPDKDAIIDQHDDHFIFKIDLTQTSLDSDSNPFTGSSGNNTSSGGNNNGNGTSGSNPPGGIVSGGSSGSVPASLRHGHGVLMMFVWVILYPTGALLMPLFGKWYLHAAFQTVAFLAMWAALGVGYVMAHRLNLFWNTTHTRIGIIVCSLMALQPLLGALHHMNFKRQQRRGVLSHVHVWWGRTLILLGIINGGLGLQLAGGDRSFRISYIVIAAVIAGPYFVSIPWLEFRKARGSNSPTTKAAATGSDENASRNLETSHGLSRGKTEREVRHHDFHQTLRSILPFLGFPIEQRQPHPKCSAKSLGSLAPALPSPPSRDPCRQGPSLLLPSLAEPTLSRSCTSRSSRPTRPPPSRSPTPSARSRPLPCPRPPSPPRSRTSPATSRSTRTWSSTLRARTPPSWPLAPPPPFPTGSRPSRRRRSSTKESQYNKQTPSAYMGARN